MKLVPLLLIVTTLLSLSACNTLVTRRDQYSPKEGEGYWTKQWENRGDRPKRAVEKPGPESGIFGISHPPYEQQQAAPPLRRERGIFGISRPRYKD